MRRGPGSIKWSDAPPTLPKGAKIAVLQGDPGKDGRFVIRLLAPAGGSRIAPHWHTQDEQLTVISGMLYIGLGDKFSKRAARALPRGGFHFLPGKEHHYAFTNGRTIVQINGNGPFDINYVNPADGSAKGEDVATARDQRLPRAWVRRSREATTRPIAMSRSQARRGCASAYCTKSV